MTLYYLIIKKYILQSLSGFGQGLDFYFSASRLLILELLCSIPVDNTIDLPNGSTAFSQACFCDDTIRGYWRFQANSIMLLKRQRQKIILQTASQSFSPWVGLVELNGSCCISSLPWMDEKVSSALHRTDKEIECLQPLISIPSLNNPSILLGSVWATIMSMLSVCVGFKHTCLFYR